MSEQTPTLAEAVEVADRCGTQLMALVTGVYATDGDLALRQMLSERALDASHQLWQIEGSVSDLSPLPSEWNELSDVLWTLPTAAWVVGREDSDQPTWEHRTLPCADAWYMATTAIDRDAEKLIAWAMQHREARQEATAGATS